MEEAEVGMCLHLRADKKVFGTQLSNYIGNLDRSLWGIRHRIERLEGVPEHSRRTWIELAG